MNMTEELEVIVTEDDIAEARRLCGGRISEINCPVALAIRRQFKCCRVSVTSIRVYITADDRIDLYSVDNDGTEFIVNFDLGLIVGPTTIKLTHLWPY